MMGTYASALSEGDIAHFADEAKAKVVSKQSRLVRYDLKKDKLTEQMEVLPIAVITNKSKAFQ